MSTTTISVIPTPTAEERLVAAQAMIAKAMTEKEAAKAAAQAAKEAAIALKDAEKARRAEERAAAKAAREAEKAALPKRPVGRPRKNPLLVVATLASTPAVVADDDKDSITDNGDEANSIGSVAQSSPVAYPADAERGVRTSQLAGRALPTDTVESLRAELAELRAQLAVLQTAYQREHAVLERARKLFGTASV